MLLQCEKNNQNSLTVAATLHLHDNFDVRMREEEPFGKGRVEHQDHPYLCSILETFFRVGKKRIIRHLNVHSSQFQITFSNDAIILGYGFTLCSMIEKWCPWCLIE